ncbi:MAG: phage tail tube protein [Phycisphaerae bacterium]
MTTPSMGHLAQLGMGTGTPITDVNGQAFEFLSETLKQTETQHHSNGLRGTRSRIDDRVRTVRKAISGGIVMNPTPTEIDWLLPKILGGTTAAGVTDVADTLPEVYIQIDRIAKVHEYVKCVCGQAVLQGSSGQPLQLTTDWEGETETETAAGSFPSITLPTDNMFVFSDITLTLEGSARTIDEFTLTINNMLQDDLYRNSVSRIEIPPQDREVTLAVTLPYDTDNVDLYNAAVAGAAGILVMNDGTTTYTVNIANCKIPADSPNVAGKGEIPLQLTVNCFGDGTNSECKWTKT